MLATHQPATQHEATGQAINNEGLLSTKEAATFLGVSESLLRKDRRKHHYGIPFVKRGPRYVRYNLDDLKKWATNHSSLEGDPNNGK